MHTILVRLAAVVLLLGCAASGWGCWGAETDQPVVLLISFDGFRWDYRERFETPNFDRLAAHGIQARGLIPVFPTKTFPNHYSVVTGLYPARHGIVANVFYDPDLDETFRAGTEEAAQGERWWGGEPVWVTVEKQGLKAAAMFWPGNEAPFEGKRPTYWMPYEHEMPNEDRVEQVLQWLDLPTGERPSFITLYFSIVDSAGHRYGPDAPETAEAVAQADRLLGRLWEGLSQRELLKKVNILIVSDHGMTPTWPTQAIALDRYVDLQKAGVVHFAPATGLRPAPEDMEEVAAALADVPHARLLRRDSMPERFHYGGNPRIPPLILLADEGWSITSSSVLEESPWRLEGGTHGYDNQLQSMHGIFLAHGPAFKQGYVVEEVENIDLHPLMLHLLGLEAPPSDGRLEDVEHLLRQRP
ncbi:MAG TPA: ectonucleotide pyrophosphatase/phosphodiesterase [Acidobacteriota bacterium]|nr:ectonucleotide pyrophosphatase/phosphodiesterase [Acidobacteriota bacterium]